jgi:hypothetical protein
LLNLIVRLAIDVVEVFPQAADQPTNFIGGARHTEVLIGVGRHGLRQAVAGVSKTIDGVPRLAFRWHAVGGTANRTGRFE